MNEERPSPVKPLTAPTFLVSITAWILVLWITPLFQTAPLASAATTAPAADPGNPSPEVRVDYPGAAPGPASITVQDSAIIISNAALSISWRLRPQGFRPYYIRAGHTSSSLQFTGELFQVHLTNGARYAASALTPEGKPTVRSIAPQPAAARLAVRLPSQLVELPLRSSDGQLRVLWRALVPDNANYIRQEIEVTALRESTPPPGSGLDD